MDQLDIILNPTLRPRLRSLGQQWDDPLGRR